MKVGGIILCGGKSSRMGADKAALPFGPELMLTRVVRLLGQIVEPIVVVAAADQELPELPTNVIVARDQRPEQGPLEGLHAGLSALQGLVDAVYATSCDVPLLENAFVERMIQLLGEHDAAVPVEGKFHHPLAAVYRTSLLPQVESLLAQQRLRPFFLFEQVDTLRVPVDDLRQVDPDLNTLMNLNRPEDYRAALQQAGFDVPPE